MNKISGSYDTPILFITFNRPKETKTVFNQIKLIQPKTLYISSDGPRSNKENEKKIVSDLRDSLLGEINWECNIKTLFREKNLGCKHAVSSAISWFFSNEESGIILEDDCLPNLSFFHFCSEILNKYHKDLRVWQISGTNLNNGWVRDKTKSYYYSYYGSIWGWATWRDRWSHYDLDIKDFDEVLKGKFLEDVFGNKKETINRIQSLKRIKSGFDTWDFQWNFIKHINSGLSIVPTKNLIKNIGFGMNATHTMYNDEKANLELEDMHFPLVSPKFLIRDKVSDDYFFNKEFNKPLFKRLLTLLSRFKG